MINSITLKNFQSHKDTHVEFHSGVNAIVGLSDSGKTAILRALNWVVNNKPSGDAFASHWGGDCVVTVELWDGTTISRGRTKTDNYYSLNGEMYRAFGQDVPEPVRKAFNMNEINIQAQMDAPFLLSSGPGEVAQILNRVVNLDVIDRAVSNIRKKKLEVDRELKSARERVETLHQELEKFAFLPDMEREVSELEELEAEKDAKEKQQMVLERLCADHAKLEQSWQKSNAILAAEPALQQVFDLQERQALVQQKIQGVETISRGAAAWQETVKRTEKLMKAEAEVRELEGLVVKEQEMVKKLTALTTLTMSVQTKENQVDKFQAMVRDLEKKFHALMPEQCPLCGQEVE